MKIIQTTIATIILAIVPIPDLEAQTILTNGLVAYYPFNGNANDSIGTRHGTVIGAVLTTNRVGVASAAYNFNGSSSRIEFSSPPLTQVANWTLAAWVKPENFSGEAVVVQVGFDNANTGNGYGIGFLNSTPHSFFSGVGFYSSGQSLSNLNQWYHLAMVRDSSTTRFFINGIQTANIFSTTPNAPTDFTIGSQNGVRYFDGSIDEVRIYNRALSASEVAQLHNENEFCTPHIAKATATIVNGFVVGATVTDPSCGYSNAPMVTIQGGGGSGATATATVSGGSISAINITSAGCCYTNAPTIIIQSPTFVPTVGIAVSRVNVTQHVMLGRNYVLESSTDFITWTPTGPQFTAESEDITTEFVVAQTGRYFRLREVP
ncbi:MAG: LamG domain-containing protein [Verrucomicrobiota bacterium]